MNPYNMDLFIWSGLYSFIANLVIGLFVYSRDPSKRVNLLFLFFSMCVACWSVGSFLVNIISDKELALRVLRINYLFAVWLPPLYITFISILIKKSSNLIKPGYLVSTVLSIFVFTPFFIKGLKIIETTNFYISDPGLIYFIFFIFFAVCMLEVLSQTFNQSQFSWASRQFLYIGVTNCLSIFAGFEYFSRVFGFFKTPPFDDYVLIVYVLILAFAIIKHDVFNIEAIAQAFQREKLVTIGLLATSVNHEIKNPLYAAREQLNLYIESLKQNVPVRDPLQTSEKIKHQIDRVLEVITKLNRFAKPITDETLVNHRASISEAIQTVLDLISYEFKSDKIKINNQIPSDLPYIQADQRQLEEILFNLIVNACHAMENGGTLVIAGEQIHSLPPLWGKVRMGVNLRINPPPLSSPTRGEEIGLRNSERIHIIISDTGSGISPEQMKHLFEPFHTTKGDKGTGLGLYITKQLVERNGGKITVKSEKGKGTSFILEFQASSQR